MSGFPVTGGRGSSSSSGTPTSGGTVPNATSTVRGTVEIATFAETVDGSSNAVVTTPAGVSRAIDARPISGGGGPSRNLREWGRHVEVTEDHLLGATLSTTARVSFQANFRVPTITGPAGILVAPGSNGRFYLALNLGSATDVEVQITDADGNRLYTLHASTSFNSVVSGTTPAGWKFYGHSSDGFADLFFPAGSTIRLFDIVTEEDVTITNVSLDARTVRNTFIFDGLSYDNSTKTLSVDAQTGGGGGGSARTEGIVEQLQSSQSAATVASTTRSISINATANRGLAGHPSVSVIGTLQVPASGIFRIFTLATLTDEFTMIVRRASGTTRITLTHVDFNFSALGGVRGTAPESLVLGDVITVYDHVDDLLQIEAPANWTFVNDTVKGLASFDVARNVSQSTVYTNARGATRFATSVWPFVFNRADIEYIGADLGITFNQTRPVAARIGVLQATHSVIFILQPGIYRISANFGITALSESRDLALMLASQSSLTGGSATVETVGAGGTSRATLSLTGISPRTKQAVILNTGRLVVTTPTAYWLAGISSGSLIQSSTLATMNFTIEGF